MCKGFPSLTFACRAQKYINPPKSFHCFRNSCLALSNDSRIQSNDPQTLAPSFRPLYFFEKPSEVLALAFSFLKLKWHHACYYIVAMFKDLPRQCNGNGRYSPGDEPYSWSVVRWEVWGARAIWL